MKVAYKHDIPNPRDFIKSAPIPVPYKDKGIKIQARCFNVYNASVPERAIVRKDNYDRRLIQMNSMGFSSQINQPYKILGEPLYLDQKKLVLHGLGQLPTNEEIQQEIENIETNKVDTTETKAPQVSKFTFASLKKSKHLIDINSEVNKTNHFIKSVKLGHSIFDLIEEEDRLKKETLDKEKRQALEVMQIRPLEDSDDEESDDIAMARNTSSSLYRQEFDYMADTMNTRQFEEMNNIDNRESDRKFHEVNDFLDLRKPTNKISERTRQSSHHSHSVPASAMSSNLESHSQISTKRKSNKLKDPPKPYALVHTALSQPSKTDFPMDGTILTRQLCVLLWLLETINVEPPNVIGPLRTCFLIKDLGGAKISEKALNKSKAADLDWITFKRSHGTKQHSARPQLTREERIKNRKKQTSVVGVNESTLTDDTMDDETIEIIPIFKGHADSIQEHPNSLNIPTLPLTNGTDRQDDDHGPAVHNHNEFQSSTFRDPPNTGNTAANTSTTQLPTAGSTNQAAHANEKNSDKRHPRTVVSKSHKKQPNQQHDNHSGLTKQDIQIIKIGDPEEMERVFSKVSFRNERKDAKHLRADCGPIKASWTQAVLDYQKTLPSMKKTRKLNEIKDKFVDVTDKNSIELNNRLEEINKRRLKSCITKFTFMDPNERGVHKMIHKMNEKINEKQRMEDLRKTPSSQFHKWYLDIERLIDTYYNRNDCYVKLILERLANYAKLSSKKMNETKFFTTLDNLRTWELLAPEVMSAIEFCRERILEIKPEDFDAWFQSKHPESFVPRPEPPKRRIKTAVD